MSNRLRWLLLTGAIVLGAVVGPASRLEAGACTT